MTCVASALAGQELSNLIPWRELGSSTPKAAILFQTRHTIAKLLVPCDTHSDDFSLSLNSQNYIVSHDLHAQGTADVTSQVEEALRRLERCGVTITRPAEARNYLLEYSNLAEPLVSCCDAVIRRFGWSAQLELELYQDPEIQDEYLTLYVRMESYGEDVLAIIEEVSEEIALALIGQSGWFLLTTDFGRPR